MRAELVIEHQAGDPLVALRAAFGEHNAAALEQSSFARKSPRSAAAITYAGVGPGLVLLAWPTEKQLYLYVESSGGRLRKSAADVWDIVRKGDPGLRAKLKSLVLFDEDANDTVVEANVGLLPNLRRPELFLTLATGAASAMWLVVAVTAFDATGDLVLGAIPALVAAILALVILAVDVRSKSLVWK
jgi:hypothetical protein